MRVTLTNEGLIAYLLLNKIPVIDSGNGAVTFESEKTGKEWRQSHANSEFSDYNAKLFEARNLKKGIE